MVVLKAICILFIGFGVGVLLAAFIIMNIINSEIKYIEKETKDLHGHNLHR